MYTLLTCFASVHCVQAFAAATATTHYQQHQYKCIVSWILYHRGYSVFAEEWLLYCKAYFDTDTYVMPSVDLLCVWYCLCNSPWHPSSRLCGIRFVVIILEFRSTVLERTELKDLLAIKSLDAVTLQSVTPRDSGKRFRSKHAASI